jgi:hypothetical protein
MLMLFIFGLVAPHLILSGMQRCRTSLQDARVPLPQSDLLCIFSLDDVLSQANPRWEFLGESPYVPLCGSAPNPILTLLFCHSQYTTMLDDSMSLLKVESVRKIDGQRVQQKIFRVMPVPPSEAPRRQMIPANPQSPEVAVGIGAPIRVMTYNILCKTYADAKQYPYTPQYALDWEYRKRIIINEMTQQYTSDIICLQECEKADYEESFLPALTEAGFTGDYQKRPGVKQDGCAVFFNSQKYDYFQPPPVILPQYNRFVGAS